jgi:hypothetical protein
MGHIMGFDWRSVKSYGRRAAAALVLLTAFALPALAADDLQAQVPLDANGLPQWTIAVWNDFPVMIELADRAALDALLAAVPVASFDREQIAPLDRDPKSERLAFRPRVTGAEFAALEAAGYAPQRLRDFDREGREAAERVWMEMARNKTEPVLTAPYNYYPTHAQMGTILATIETNYPAIARDFQWGTSIQGRALWGLVISDNVSTSEAEPEVRLSSSMHGDEVTGQVLLLDFAHYLTENYGVAGREDVTNLVDNYEIHLMPMYNPDGTASSQRYNANGVDLNRNFPLPAGEDPTQEIENQQFMNYANGHHFVLSSNYHGGALVVNYPWDYTYTLAPDDAACIKFSLEYSTYNSPMYNGAFDQGITNGAAWYVALGTLQDWSYDQTDCIDVTIEVSNTKWPAGSQLPTFWNENRESLMHYVKSARYGVNGVVTGSDTGQPLDATVTVTGNSVSVHTDPSHGDYYKLLDTGTYALTFSSPGYITRTITGVSTTWGTPTVLDVALDPVAYGSIAGHVMQTGGAPVAAQVKCYTHPLNALVATVNANASGDYTVPSQVYGDYRLVYSAAGHATAEQVVTLDAASVTAPDVTLGLTVELTPFATNFENGLTDGWTREYTWGLLAGGPTGSTYEMTDSPVGNYLNNQTSSCTMTAGVDLTDMDSGTVSFQAKWNIETNWDGVQFQVSIDGGTVWTPIATAYTQSGSGQGKQTAGQPYFENAQASWVLNTVDLAPWLGQANVRFRFRLATDSSTARDGFHFDDFTIHGLGQSPNTGAGDAPSRATAITAAYPNPFNPSTTVSFTLAGAGRAELALYDAAGHLVRTLVAEDLAAGEHAAVWDGQTEGGSRAPSGVYFARLTAAGISSVQKLMLVK